MDKNVGGLDRKMRIGAGALSGAVSLSILGGLLQTNELYALILGILSVVTLGTAYTQKCPVCNALGHDSYEE